MDSHFFGRRTRRARCGDPHVQAGGKDLAQLAPENFSLPTLGPVLSNVLASCSRAAASLCCADCRSIATAAQSRRSRISESARYLGAARSQNAKGHLLGHVKDLGLDIRDPNVRYYQTSRKLEYHTDSVDIVGLLCLQPAKAGARASSRAR
jgi:hypothetical protein